MTIEEYVERLGIKLTPTQMEILIAMQEAHVNNEQFYVHGLRSGKAMMIKILNDYNKMKEAKE